jgi:acyl-coenzyme A synthetase/AMP-(fatty) acid ligase
MSRKICEACRMSDLITAFFDRLSPVEGAVLSCISEGERRTVAGTDLAERLDRVAAFLAETGVTPGDRAVAVFDNTLESALILLTAMRHGITLCLQPSGVQVEDLMRLKADLSAKAIVNATGTDIEGTTQILLDDLDEFPPVLPAPVAPHTPFTITFTSGSTGAPKGVVHSVESFLTCAEAFNRQSGITEQDRFLNVMPMFYMAGIFNGILAPLAAGASVVIGEAFNTATAMRFWQTIAVEGISALWLSPTMLSLVVRLDRTDKTVSAGFRRLFVGTGAMAVEDAEYFHKTYGLPPLQSYGLSELLYISVDSGETPNFGTVGYLLEGVSLNGDTDEPLAIASPYGFLGYLIDGALQRHKGSFLTSDLAELSESGTLSILGRVDDTILRGGVNVNPLDLEAALAPIMKGQTFCITGMPDATLGQKVVVVMEGEPLRDDAFAKAQKIIRDHPGRAQLDEAAQVAKLPLGLTGKIRRSALRAMLERDGA